MDMKTSLLVDSPLAAPNGATDPATSIRPAWIIAAFAVLLALAVPFQTAVYPVFVMKVLCYALFASAFNLLLGFGGLLSFGHAAFFGSASYVTAYLCTAMGVGPATGIAVGVLAAAALGALMGGVAIRRQGIYFAMVTLALAQLVYFVALQSPYTGGEDGMQNVPRGRLFGIIDLASDTAMYYVVLFVSLGGFALIYRTIHSPFGEVLRAIRENEARAMSLGYQVNRYKLLAFVLSAALSGLAGSTKALAFQVATLGDVHWHASGEVILMTLLGGVGTLLGPVVGATVVVALQKYLSGAGAWSTVVMGCVFMVCVLMFRRGIVGEVAAAVSNRFARRGDSASV
jgi:branched-chain amino acid transport system permease protein